MTRAVEAGLVGDDLFSLVVVFVLVVAAWQGDGYKYPPCHPWPRPHSPSSGNASSVLLFQSSTGAEINIKTCLSILLNKYHHSSFWNHIHNFQWKIKDGTEQRAARHRNSSEVNSNPNLHVIEFVQCRISNDFAKPLLFECVFLGLINFQSLWKITWVERQEDDCRCTELSQVWIKLKSKQSKLFICQYSWQTMRSFSEICPQTDPGSPRITINYEFLIPAPPQFKFIIPQQWQHTADWIPVVTMN